MCYVCREGLGDVKKGGEGYRHFCQHFRLNGGECRECARCDLYKAEDDEVVAKRAAARAEKEWREKEGMVGVEGLGGPMEVKAKRMWYTGDWTLQGFVDWWVDGVLVC